MNDQPRESVWRRFGAVFIFGVLWISFAVVHGAFEYLTAWERNREHGLDSADGWQMEWARSMFENLQSEAWQVTASAIVIEVVRNRRRWFTAAEDQ